MAKKTKKTQIDNELKLTIVNPNAAGIDVADSEMQVCVPIDRDENNNRRFGAYTKDLREISQWLKDCKIDTVAMEATGVYWIPLFLKLQEDGFDVMLTNAKDAKNVSGKKTDISDAQHIMVLHSYGLLKASYQPDNYARQIRTLARYRNELIKESSTHILHMQKAMEMMNIKLTNTISDIVGKSGLDIIQAIVDGERDPYILAELADPRCKSTKQEIAQSLEGTWDRANLYILKMSYDKYISTQSQINNCEKEIHSLTSEYVKDNDVDLVQYRSTNKRVNKKNRVDFDIEYLGFKTWGTNPMEIPGLSGGSILQLIGELGSDFIDKFDTPEQFCSWCNLVPNNKISGGKLISSKVPKRKNPVGQIFKMCASSQKKAKNPLGDFFRRISSRDGYKSATLATAHKIAKIFYMMVKQKTHYDEQKVGINQQEVIEKKIRRMKEAIKKLEQKACKSVS